MNLVTFFPREKRASEKSCTIFIVKIYFLNYNLNDEPYFLAHECLKENKSYTSNFPTLFRKNSTLNYSNQNEFEHYRFFMLQCKNYINWHFYANENLRKFLQKRFCPQSFRAAQKCIIISYYFVKCKRYVYTHNVKTPSN